MPDLRVYAQAFDGEVLHYRDNKGVEVDAIVALGDGRCAALEVKMGESSDGPLGWTRFPRALQRLSERIDLSRSWSPAFLGIITAGRFGYVRDDGIAVIPIGLLGP